MKTIGNLCLCAFLGLNIAASLAGCTKGSADNLTRNPYNGKTTVVFNPNKIYDILTDQDGNNYKIITLGNQTWMAENLRTTKYRNGEKLPEISQDSVWRNTKSAAYCNYQNTTNVDTIATLGRLYNWFAVANKLNLAPSGWHVASDEEWATLASYLEGENFAGEKMKESGFTHWPSPNSNASNESGFSVLPSGSRDNSGPFGNKALCFFWSSTQSDPARAWYCGLAFGTEGFYRGTSGLKQYGFSVRCIKD